MLGNLLGGFVVVLVGTTLIPTVSNQIALARYINGSSQYGSNGSSVTGAAGSILDLTVVFFALGVMSAGAAMAIGGLKQAGLI